MPMDKELKAKWIADLRRDDIRQTRAKLCDGTAHCCLGRLYEVAGIMPLYDPRSRQYVYEGIATGMPKSETLDGWGLRYDHADELAAMNDHGDTFKQIADYIESHEDI